MRFLDRVARLDSATVRALSAWTDDPDDVSRALAQRTAARALRAVGPPVEWRDVSDGLRAWASSPRDLVPRPEILAPRFGSFDIDEMGERVRALRHLLDAAAALFLGDRLGPEEREALLQPWREVVEDGG